MPAIFSGKMGQTPGLAFTQRRDKVSWNAVLTGYARRVQSEEAMTSFSEMQWETRPCKFTFETLFGSMCKHFFSWARQTNSLFHD
ncbi:hypothetical protein WN943_023937 [Citrus x changshan-huyou]